MSETEIKLKELEVKVQSLETRIGYLENWNTSENDVHTIVDNLLDEKSVMTKRDVENLLNRQQLQIVKWSAGTGISVLAVMASIMRIFFM